jgi:hypothetical protein
MRLRITSRVIAITVPAFFFAGIAASAALGWWVTEASKEPTRYETGEFAGEYNPADIRGSYTFGDIEAAFGVPVDVLAGAFGVAGDEPSDLAAYAVKNLEETYGDTGGELEIGTDAVRVFVSLWTGLPYELDPETAITDAGLALLLEAGKIDQARADVLASAVVPLPGTPIRPDTVTATETTAAGTTGTAEESDAPVVKGNTTFGELKSWGLSADRIEEIIGMPIGGNGESMRDFFSAAGVEFSTVKTRLQEAVDAER